MVNVVALAQKPKTSTLIVDSDLDMGTYSISAAKVNNYPLKLDWTISTRDTSMGVYYQNLVANNHHTILNMPPNQTVSGQIKVESNGSSIVLMCYSKYGERTNVAVSSGTSEYTIPDGTNKIDIANVGSSTTLVRVYAYTIA